MIRRIGLVMAVLGSLLALHSTVQGQDWATKMFKTTRHDFGVIARDSKAVFRFELTNPYKDEVHIVSARSSCACTITTVEKPTLKTYETGAIIAEVNTKAYRGQRSVTITVVFDKPKYAQVRLQASNNIVGDVMFSPGQVAFGTVDKGASAKQTVAVNFLTGGSLAIREIRCGNPHLATQVEKTGTRSFNLTVELRPDAPVGYLRDHIMLATGSARIGEVPLMVEGVVQSEIAISPESLFVGTLDMGTKVTKQLVLRGKKPFNITSLTSDGKCVQFPFTQTTEPRPLHLIPVTFEACGEPGSVVETIRIETDLSGDAVTLRTYAVVEPPRS